MIIRPKINLFLEITGRRPDGFHEIATVMQTVDNLTDILTVEPADDLVITVKDERSPAPVLPEGERVFSAAGASAAETIPADARNLVIKAADSLRRIANVNSGCGAAFHLVKRIPDGAGLGGGSADAAAALVLANDLWGLGLPHSALVSAAATVGSDVPFFLYGNDSGEGHVALCSGRGEIITPLNCPPLAVTLVIPPWKSATAAAYRALNPATFGRHPASLFADTLQQTAMLPERAAVIVSQSFNLFTAAIARQEPRQDILVSWFAAAGCPLILSGSGSCFWTPALPEAKKNRLQVGLNTHPILSGTLLR